jgi:hypothetical protein
MNEDDEVEDKVSVQKDGKQDNKKNKQNKGNKQDKKSVVVDIRYNKFYK